VGICSPLFIGIINNDLQQVRDKKIVRVHRVTFQKIAMTKTSHISMMRYSRRLINIG
jgi:hypothetical protein